MSLLFALFGSPAVAHAHEVYVLSPEEVSIALSTPHFSLWHTLITNLNQFVLWAFIACLVVFIVFFISISRTAEQALDPLLKKLPRFAPLVGRVTIGISLLASAYYGALFGPELPLVSTFGYGAPMVSLLLVIAGLMIVFGYHTRIAGLAVLLLFGIAVAVHGTYMLTYTNYAGELFLLFVLGAHVFAIHHKAHDLLRTPAWLARLKRMVQPYAFMILRIAFGISLLYASLYAKILHNSLALAVATAYPGVVTFFGFEPHFLVLGAAIIEIVIALFFILGIEIRFTSLFLLFWLSLSLWYFGEVVWPHLILIGIPIAFIFYGYDKYSLEGRWFKRGDREPVL